MNRKNIILVIILASIFALITALLLKNAPQKTPTTTLFEDSSIEEPLQQEVEQVQDKTEEQSLISEEKEDTKTPPAFTEPKVQNLSTYKKLELKEVYTHQEENTTEPTVDFGVMDDNGTIVVTKEFKMKSPTKYYFEGFGTLQKAPTK